MTGVATAVIIRGAHPSEAGLLTALAIRSKAHWGYDAAFMEAAVHELTIEVAHMESGGVFVAERDDVRIGFYYVSVEEGRPTLRDLWVEPALIGTGVGSVLWRHMLGEAGRRGYAVVRIESDPNAAAFYAKMGARRVGSVASTVVAGRVLPLFEMEI